MSDTVAWKLFWTAMGGAVTLLVGTVPVVAHLSLLAVIPLAALLGALAALLAGLLVRRCDLFDGVKPENLNFIVTLIRLAIVLHVAWVVTFQLRPDWLLWWPLVLVTLSAAEYAYAYGKEFLTEKMPAKPDAATAEAAAERDKPTRQMRDALRKSDLGVVVVEDWDPTVDDDGHVFGIDYQIKIPSKATQRGA